MAQGVSDPDPADRRLFVLNDEQWHEFTEMLDREPVEKPRLRKLLTEPTVLDDDQ